MVIELALDITGTWHHGHLTTWNHGISIGIFGSVVVCRVYPLGLILSAGIFAFFCHWMKPQMRTMVPVYESQHLPEQNRPLDMQASWIILGTEWWYDDFMGITHGFSTWTSRNLLDERNMWKIQHDGPLFEVPELATFGYNLLGKSSNFIT